MSNDNNVHENCIANNCSNCTEETYNLLNFDEIPAKFTAIRK